MLTIFAGRKGGSGKSTLACNLAPLIASSNKSVCLVDYDPQRTATKWGEYRTEAEGLAEVSVIDAFRGDFSLKGALESFDHVLVDVAGSDNEMNRALIAEACRYNVPIKMVIPVKPSQPDLDTLSYVVEELIERIRAIRPDVSIHFVLNESPTTTKREREEALQYFKALGLEPIPTSLHSRKAFRDSMAFGKSAAEMADQKAAEEIRSVYTDIYSNTDVIQ